MYILKSLTDPDRHYTGRTSNITRRLEWHNAGLITHTARYRPWRLLVSMEFHDHSAAAWFNGVILLVPGTIALYIEKSTWR